MWREFKSFLIKQNALALAVAVVIGAALNEVVKAIVDGLIMPIVGAITPGGDWRTMIVPVGRIEFRVGIVLAALLNFLIVGFVAWRLSKLLLPSPTAPATKACPFCRQSDLDTAATRCPHCTSQLG